MRTRGRGRNPKFFADVINGSSLIADGKIFGPTGEKERRLRRRKRYNLVAASAAEWN